MRTLATGEHVPVWAVLGYYALITALIWWPLAVGTPAVYGWEFALFVTMTVAMLMLLFDEQVSREVESVLTWDAIWDLGWFLSGLILKGIVTLGIGLFVVGVVACTSIQQISTKVVHRVARLRRHPRRVVFFPH